VGAGIPGALLKLLVFMVSVVAMALVTRRFKERVRIAMLPRASSSTVFNTPSSATSCSSSRVVAAVRAKYVRGNVVVVAIDVIVVDAARKIEGVVVLLVDALQEA
jgi:hypothetical protein